MIVVGLTGPAGMGKAPTGQKVARARPPAYRPEAEDPPPSAPGRAAPPPREPPLPGGRGGRAQVGGGRQRRAGEGGGAGRGDHGRLAGGREAGEVTYGWRAKSSSTPRPPAWIPGPATE